MYVRYFKLSLKIIYIYQSIVDFMLFTIENGASDVFKEFLFAIYVWVAKRIYRLFVA